MKKLSILFLSLIAAAVTITSCHSDNPTPAPTELALTIKDQNDAVVKGVKVVLYSDSNFTTKLDSITTDATGIAKFSKNLKSQIYYFDANGDQTTGCLSNFFTEYQTVDTNNNPVAIPLNKTTSMDVHVLPTGALNITNNSTTDAYNFYFIYPGDTTYYMLTKVTASQSFTYPMTEGTVSVKWIKLDASGNEITGSDIVQSNISVTACNATPVQPL